jgi:hypothetical protein
MFADMPPGNRTVDQCAAVVAIWLSQTVLNVAAHETI